MATWKEYSQIKALIEKYCIMKDCKEHETLIKELLDIMQL